MDIIQTIISTTLFGEKESVLPLLTEVRLFWRNLKVGYYSRVAAIEIIVKRFIQECQGQCQIVNLGGGYDTLFFRLHVIAHEENDTIGHEHPTRPFCWIWPFGNMQEQSDDHSSKFSAGIGGLWRLPVWCGFYFSRNRYFSIYSKADGSYGLRLAGSLHQRFASFLQRSDSLLIRVCSHLHQSRSCESVSAVPPKSVSQ